MTIEMKTPFINELTEKKKNPIKSLMETQTAVLEVMNHSGQ